MKKFKKLVASLLAVLMVLSLAPVTALADGLELRPIHATEQVEEEPAEQPEEEVLPEEENAASVAEQAATANYAVKNKSVPLKEDTFYRIVHLDCGRKYFNVTEIKKVIDYASESNYTHVELAFGNDGLRFLLDDMSLTVDGKTYSSDDVKNAIKKGNEAYTSKSSGELTQAEMEEIISYAKSKNIGIIPMFDSPGHLYAVIEAMNSLGITMIEGTNYCKATKSGESYNRAILTTDGTCVNFVQALVQKYIAYFAGKVTMFNIAADECGFSSNSDTGWNGMSNEQYTAYVKFVNSLAAIVQNAGMTALAFNDGIYHKNLNSSTDFDTDIAICYWDTSTEKYASASALAEKGFKIINTHNKWYYVLGTEDGSWFGYQWSNGYMNGDAKSCMKIDGDTGSTIPKGCMNALWCDNPSASVNWNNVESHIKLLSTNNSDVFTKVETPETPDPVIKISKGSVTAELQEDNSYVVKVKAGDTIELIVENSTGTFNWNSDNENVATAESGKVTFTGKEGKVTITAISSAANDGSTEPKQYSIVFDVHEAGKAEITEKAITITVGATATDYIDGETYSGQYTTEDPNVAIVEKTEATKIEGSTKRNVSKSATGLQSNGTYDGLIADAKGNYLVVSGSQISSTTAAENATVFTVTKNNNGAVIKEKNGSYYLTRSNNTLSLTTNQPNNSWRVGSGNDFYYSSGQYYYLAYSNGWKATTTSDWDSCGKLYSFTDTTVETKSGTTITFKGVSVGTTYVTIGDTRYTINVVAEDLSKVSSLPIQLWITNNTIEATGNNAKTTGSGWGGDSSLGSARYISIDASLSAVSGARIFSEQGMAVADAFEAAGQEEPLKRYEWGGTRFITARDDKAAQNLVFWTGRIHNSTDSNIQKVWDDDYSTSGAAFEYIRYWGGAWQVSENRETWTTVTGEGSTGTYSGCKQQLAAYFMTRTEITEEITTDVADWGKPKGSSDYDDQVSGDFVLLDFAVKYGDSEEDQVPTNFPVANKTLAYHCKSGDSACGQDSSGNRYRMLNNFRAVEDLGKQYELYMVTVRMTSGSASTTLTSSKAQNGYTYDDTTEQVIWAIDQETRDKVLLDDYTAISGSETYSGCKIGGEPYIRGIEVYNKHGALITYYLRAKATVETKLTVNYYVQGVATPFYTYDIAVKADTLFDASFARTENPIGLTGNTVENSNGRMQTVNWKLNEMTEVGAQYRYADYEFVEANREENGKVVNLYYTFSYTKQFVVDFGLPLFIKPSDIHSDLEKATITGITVTQNSTYAKITKMDDNSIKYELNKIMSANDVFYVQYSGSLMVGDKYQSGQTAQYTITVIPASTVYYEDSFAEFHDAKGFDVNEGIWQADGTEKTANQALEVLGSKTNLYGHDGAYKDSTTFSMGSAHKVTVSKEMADKWSDGTNEWPTATFTFKGTGFDVISLTDNNSGTVIYKVENTATGDVKYNKIVNNYYGYTYTEGKGWEATPSDANNALYQIPVITVRDLEYAEYKVTLTVGYGAFFDKTGDDQYSFWLDAIRVYDPMGKDNETYKQDKEGYPQYIKLRNELANGTATSKLVFIDGKAEANVAEYKNFGPNNEVYLANGQAISFKLNIGSAEIDSIQIGAKAPSGTAKLLVNNIEVVSELKTATEMYYDITDSAKGGNVVTITNTGDGILSLTNLKITYSEKGSVSLAAMNETEQTNAVMMVRTLFAPPAPVVFEPETFTVKLNYYDVYVREYVKVTVTTSNDVDYITVGDKKITRYTEERTWGGFHKGLVKTGKRIWSYYVSFDTAGQQVISVVAYDADGLASEAVDNTVNVKSRSSRRGRTSEWHV